MCVWSLSCMRVSLLSVDQKHEQEYTPAAQVTRLPWKLKMHPAYTGLQVFTYAYAYALNKESVARQPGFSSCTDSSKEDKVDVCQDKRKWRFTRRKHDGMSLEKNGRYSPTPK